MCQTSRKRTWVLEDNFPEDQRLICSAVGKLQTPPQMKRKEWIWALITDDRVCCLSALWSQFINIRAETKCNQNLNRPIALQLKSPVRRKRQILIERERERNNIQWKPSREREIFDYWLLAQYAYLKKQRHTHTRTHHNAYKHYGLLSSPSICNDSHSGLWWSFKIQLGNNDWKSPSSMNRQFVEQLYTAIKYSFIHVALLHTI